MNCNEIFKVDLKSLDHLSSIRVAINLWERLDVKEKINQADSFHGIDYLTCDPNEATQKEERLLTSAQKIANYVIEQACTLNLPETVLPGLKIFIIKIGQKIFYWRQYVTGFLKLNLIHAETIFWTSYGQIDELKILTEVWLKDRSFPGVQCECFLGNAHYCAAVMYGQEEFVQRHFESMKGYIFSHTPAWCSRRYNWTPEVVMLTWLFLCEMQRKTPAVRELKNLKSINSIPVKDLFLKCLKEKNEFGVKYYWNKLNANERQNLVIDAALSCLNNRSTDHGMVYENYYTRTLTSVTSYAKEKTIKLLLFFMDFMTELQRFNFMRQHFIILFKLFFQVWPYQDFCHKFLYQMWDHVPSHQKEIFTFIINKLMYKGADSPDYFTMKNFYRKIVQDLLEKISKDLKVSILVAGNYKIFHELYKILDNETLNLLINDDDLKNQRAEILQVGNNYFREFLVKGNYNSINKFIRNMKFSAEEIKAFKESFNLLNGFLISGDLNLAETHLKWLFDTEEERNKLKNNVNANDIYFVLIQNCKFKTADKFLLWRFDFEEEREKVKNPLKSEEFVIKKIFEIWGGKNVSTNPKSSAEKCSELLKWYFKTEEEAAEFKRLKIIQDEFFVEKFWNAQFDKKTLANVDQFLAFCLKSPDEIQAMKTNIADNINWWIDSFALEKDQFAMVQALIDWVYADDHDGKKTVIKNYMSSPRSSLLCLRIFKNCSEKSPSPIVKFFNTWIDPSFNFFEYNMQLDKCDPSIYGPEIISCVRKLLKVREHNEMVTSWNLHDHVTFESSFTGGSYVGYSGYHDVWAEDYDDGDGYYDDDHYFVDDDDYY